MREYRVIKDYKSLLSIKETEDAIKFVRDNFEHMLCKKLNLSRVSAPLFVLPSTGLNDNLNGFERRVSFKIKGIEEEAEVVQSLAKWKRNALKEYNFNVGEGLYTNMNAIRCDEDLDYIHSCYVDQWDWEKVISKDQRNVEYLKKTVQDIVNAIADAKEGITRVYPQLTKKIDRNVTFITSQELEDLYPNLSPKERENAFVKKHHTIFIMQIGDVLKSGERHDGRAPDYDDWKLNGDLIMYNEVLDMAFEVSSMGIRVDEETLRLQLAKSEHEERLVLPFHKMLLNGELPLSIGGGIGQSRLCMLLLEKAHIGEVHTSIWPDEMVKKCKAAGIEIL